MTRRLTLTFDNGPVPGITEAVLDVLRDRGLTATFFVVGTDLQKPGRRDLVARARGEGHRVGNHTMTHSVLLGRTDDPAAPEKEIAANQDLLGDLASEERFFRPWGDGGVLGPHLLSPQAIDLLERGGYSLVLWNSVPRDWEDATGWPARARADIDRQDWTVLVLHDNSPAVEQLAGFLDAVVADGVEIRSDFPDECVPIRRGVRTGSLEGLVSA
ncbi:polysaccharide deacetylase family protein [Microbacterium sp.]|uniref:polysaccharide deacetylase family protein n=1 Tax=Microbacterium sp. TaxID=51671 RepID=UPI002D775067|nr:polysaccharide deacetylase family protein [Microbacterium sp.]HET6299970.1 polysaccharide deacetylase family protein [Microbacterium sp.]